MSCQITFAFRYVPYDAYFRNAKYNSSSIVAPYWSIWNDAKIMGDITKLMVGGGTIEDKVTNCMFIYFNILYGPTSLSDQDFHHTF